MHRHLGRSFPVASALTLLALACGGTDPSGDPRVPPSVAADLAAGTSRRVIVVMAGGTQSAALSAGPASGAALVQARSAEWARIKADVLESVPADAVGVVTAYEHLPAVHLEVRSADGLRRLLDRPEVVGIYEDEPHEASLAQSLPLIGQPAAAAAGATGQGTAVAILDTGVDYRRPEFGSCTAPGTPSSCRVPFAADFAPDDGQLDSMGHGTNVAAIVAAVAPSTRILALDVFNGQYAFSSDILSAIDWCIHNRDAYGIAAMNLSLGSGGSTAPCGNDVFAPAIAAARDAGILAAIASGNGNYTDRIASPACAPAAVSVGAVYDSSMGPLSWGSGCSDATTAADKVTCFSNSAPFLTLLAPGALITAGGTTMGGTSQASPHVAGAIAVLRARFPTDSVDQTVERLRATGKSVVDPRNGLVTPRLDLAAAVGQGGDVSPPTGTVAIQGGAAYTRTLAVTLTLSATDASGVASMCVSNGTTCSAWEPFAATKAWTLSAGGSGVRTVRVWLADAWGNVTPSPVSDTIVYDATAATRALTSVVSAGRVAVSWSGFPGFAPHGDLVHATDGAGSVSSGVVRTAAVP